MLVESLLLRIKDQHNALLTARRQYAEQLAPKFNVFDFIEPTEVKISAIMAWMLNPDASHDQGSRFLGAFLNCVGIEWVIPALSGIQVRTEAPTPDGRIDILVEGAGRALAIEVKAGAADQEAQLSRYLAHLRSSYPSEGYCLIYLTGNKDPTPSKASISNDERVRSEKAGELKALNYDALIPWLETCRGISRASRITMFLDEFQRFLSTRFSGARDMTERDQLVKTVVASQQTLEPAMQIIIAADAIRDDLLSSLQKMLMLGIEEYGWTLSSWKMPNWGKYSGFSLDVDPTSEYLFRLEFEYSTYNGLVYGLVKRRAESPGNEAVRNAMDAEIGPGKANDSWIWLRYASLQDPFWPLDLNWQTSTQPWLKIESGEMVVEIIARAKRISEILARRSG